MQLRFKKICLLSTIIIYCASFLLQSNLGLLQARAQERNIPRVNIVAILVDSKIYDGISEGLEWYASEYIQGKLADTKSLVIPLDLSNIDAYDIYRMMENIYFDGLENVNSSLIGLIMFGDVPLPVVNQNGYIFPTVYPYVDFENQKYVYDSESKYFVPNGNLGGQAEIWHGLINYGTNIDAYYDFFDKISKYVESPDDFIGDSMWYEDLISQKKGFVEEKFPYYRNRIMFGEDLGYQRHSPLMRQMFRGEGTENASDLMSELEEAGGLEFEGWDKFNELSTEGIDSMHTTKMVEQEIKTSFISDYNEIFSNNNLSTMRENVFAGGRWVKEYEDSDGKKSLIVDSDSSASKIQLKDDMYLGNDNLEGLIENINDLMEEMIDRKVEEKHYSMDIVVPLSYKKTTGMWIKRHGCFSFVDRFDNYYFGNNAFYIDKAEDLSIYRGTYRNLEDLSGVTYDSLAEGKNPTKSEYEDTDLRLRSIGGSYDIFSSQAAGNRGFTMVKVEDDLDIYDEEKVDDNRDFVELIRGVYRMLWPKFCDEEDCETIPDFVKRWWGGASSINLDNSEGINRYYLKDYIATDSWRPIFAIDGSQSLKPGEDEGPDGKGWVDGRGVGPQWAAVSYKAFEKYASPTLRETWGRVRRWLAVPVLVVYANHTPDVHTDFSNLNYWDLPEFVVGGWKDRREYSRIFHLYEGNSGRVVRCGNAWDYAFKVISSIVIHKATTDDQINGIDRDRYGENGILTKYYRDVKSSYEDLQVDMDDVLKTFSELIKKINTANAYMKAKLNALQGKLDQISEINDSLEKLNSDLIELENELREAEAESQDLDSIRSEIQDINDDIELENKKKEAIQADIKKILQEISQLIKEENRELEYIYKIIMGLFAQNITNVLDFLIYLEGGNPDDYHPELGGNGGSVKILFKSEWIDDIKNIDQDIINKTDVVEENYDYVYNLIVDQQGLWNELAEKLKEEYEEYEEDIDAVSDEMNGIFEIFKNSCNVEEDNDDYGEFVTDRLGSEEGDDSGDEGECNITLTKDTAEKGMDDFLDDLGLADKVFDNAVAIDTIGPRIVRAAKGDADFIKWMVQHSVNFREFSDNDWINQYAQWVKGPGYDSQGAIDNHDLLKGVSEHLSGMNILTPDRPIDSPRYLDMQSIAGNEIKLIYPDLFKVEVYENDDGLHSLLHTGDIKNNLIKYLQGKIDEYNTILANECDNALPIDIYFSRLNSIGFPLATPDPSVHSCGDFFSYDDFIDAIGGEEMLDAIAEILYYQSITNKKTKSAESVENDIKKIKKSFNINDKRELVLSDYLVEGNEKIKNPLFVIPTYEMLGYEVAFINSDGKDYIIPSEDDELLYEMAENSELKNLSKKDPINLNRYQPTQQEKDLDDECNIPSNGVLPIFKLSGTSVSSPWFEGLKCRWKKTLEEPVKINLRFDSSLSDIIVSEGFDDFIESLGKSLVSDVANEFTDRGDAMSKYADEWDTLIKTKEEKDSDKRITQKQVEADKHNREVSSGEGGDSNVLSKFYKSIKIENSNATLSDSNPWSELKIGSIYDVGNVTVEFAGIGDGCLSVDGNVLCDGGSFSKSFNPNTDPFTGLVYSADHIAGKFGLDMKISFAGGFIEKIIKYTISPSFLDRFEIEVEDDKTVAGMISPVSITGYDKYDNVVSWGLEKYDFTVSQGRFLKDGAYQDSFKTNDFRDLKFYYQAPLDAPDGSVAVIQISKSENSASDNKKYLGTYQQPITQANPIIILNGNKVLSGRYHFETDKEYRLTPDEDIYDGGKLDVSKLQRIDVEMRDYNGSIVDVDSQILVTSKNGLVVVGQVQEQEDGSQIFFETSKNYMSGGYATIYYYLTTVAGDEVISIDIPGLDTRVINLSIKPAPLENVQITLEKEVLDLGDTMNVELFLSDIWGNLVDKPYVVNLKYDDDKLDFLDYPGGGGSIDVPVGNGYKKLKVEGISAGLAFISSDDFFVTLNVDKHIMPTSGLNIMYLNYFGDDWGNQWGYFSDNKKYIEGLMKDSNKIISATTQLVSEDKIKKAVRKIEPGFKIWNPNNINTVLTMQDGNLNVVVGGISEMKVSSPSFTWLQTTVDEAESFLSNKSNAGKNYLLFIPSDLKYSVDRGILFDSGTAVGDISDGKISLKLSSYSFDNGDNVWDVVDRGTNYGSLIVHYPKFNPNVKDFSNPGERYLIDSLFTKGSSDTLSSVGIFDGLSQFELDTNYKSIQNSDEIFEQIGFLGDFKNITLFAEGETVGDATKPFGSEFVINIGDPVLSRKSYNENVYKTDFDGGIGQEIYVDSEKNIFGTYQIDFNNDGLKELLVFYTDGSAKLSKNYGGTPNLRNMQDLLRIFVPIKEIFIGDADGNGYEDILILTQNNQLRTYLNKGGVFDVDGYVACLNTNVFGGEVSSTPSDLDGIHQIFIEDMDLDNVVDVITYDEKGYIKVFYGGTTNGGPNYLSTKKYACDSGWFNREERNTTVVAALGLQVSNDDIFDNSMLRWVGLDKPSKEIEEDDLSDYGINFDPNSLEGYVRERERRVDGSIEAAVHEIMDSDKFDVVQASQKFTDDSAKYVNVTLYENTLVGGGGAKNYKFSPSSYLNPGDPDDVGSVRKNYYLKSGGDILMDGDIVTVRVTVKASDDKSFVGSFGDIIQGPRRLYYDEHNVLEGIRFLQNKRNAVVKSRDGNFSYIIDNITLSPGEKLIFEYDLEYSQIPLRDMSISYVTYWSDDDYPDIKMQSVDGCDKNFDAYVNSGTSRKFSYGLVTLQDMIDEEYLEEDSDTEDYAQDIIDNGSNVNKLPGIVGDHIGRTKLLNGENSPKITNDESGKKDLKNLILQKIENGGLEALNIDLNIDLHIFEEQTDAIENVVDDITKGMCNGFSFGGSNNCKGLPVPFNQAFLAPGKYHVFGCWELPMGKLEGGLPAFFFPGTLHVGSYDIPFPWGFKMDDEVDGFIWPNTGIYPSFLRIYAAPTLTAQLGIAVCLGPYMSESILPSPLSDVGGNCIVFAVKPQCSKDDSNQEDEDLDNPNQTYPEFIEDVRDSGVCLQSQKGFMVTQAGYRSSPFNLYSYTSQVKQTSQSGQGSRSNFNWVDGIRNNITWNNMNVNGGSNNDVEYSASFMGIIELETNSYIGSDDYVLENSIVIGDVDVSGGNFTVNKIKGGIQQGVRKLLIDKWLDPQIRYILNQLTKMHVNIKLPNMSNLIDNEMSAMQNLSENIGTIWEDRNNESTSDVGDKNERRIDPISRWSDISYDSLKNFNKSIANPFESLASLLNESNIINISTETIVVKVPMIFKEDIDAYEFYLQQWLDENSAIMDQWNSLLTAFSTSCSNEPEEKQAECRARVQDALSSYIEFRNVDWQKMQNQIYANLVILQKYREFPFEIYERIHAIDTYMAEIASLINNTIGYLSYWLSTNSQRFVGYVDAIVLIINIVKTYQLLIDFSVERGQNCGNCTKDTYDQYSCKLSMLCDAIQLPIIQIPNFKLPNITIDLTNIDLGLDIILPEFNFQPVRVVLPELPNLPEPMVMNIRLFNLPKIPILPEPPELPELPSFIPEVEIELPILPPAPEVPKLPNSIEGVIKVAKLIGKIYCIVKGQFGLVGESSVKAKIEQLTQRTYEVDWIDNIMDFTNRTAAPIHNYGVDYEIDAYVDLQFNFTDFYDYLNTLTKSINNLTTSTVNWVNTQSDRLVNNNPLTEIRDSIDGMSVDVNVDVGGLISKSDINADLDGLTSDDIEYVDYNSGKTRLKNVLSYFKQEVGSTSFGDSVVSSIGKIENQINKPNEIVANQEGVENVRKSVIDYLDRQRSGYADLANMINSDYDKFLTMVDSQSEYINTGSKDKGVLAFNVQLFNLDSSTKDSINNIVKSNPYESLVKNKQTIIDGYRNAINTNSAADLGLTKSQYLVLRDNISSMRNGINTLYNVMKPVSTTNMIAKQGGNKSTKTLLAGARIGSNMDVATVVDPSLFSKGIYEMNYDGKYTKVIYADSFANAMLKTHYRTNHTSNHDIILWNKKSVYKKFIGQSYPLYGGSYGSYYHSSVVKEIPYEETWLKFDRDTKLKIADDNNEVKGRKVNSQSYDVLSFSWKVNGADAYLIKLVERIDNSYEKSDYASRVPVHYVLALPDYTNIDEVYEKNLKLELLNKKVDKIQNYLGDELLQIVYYDSNKDVVKINISEVERKWYYLRIASLNLNDDVYNITSPWSNQVTAGKQIVGDNQPPSGEPTLFRPSTSEIVSEGDDLEGYVGTEYKLKIVWKDNVALSYINLVKDGEILDEKYTDEVEDSVSVDIDIHTKSEKEEYTTMGIDQFGNKLEKKISVAYYIPDIKITDISKNSDGGSVSIIAELSQDIDQGDVSFQRRRGSAWKTMNGDFHIGVGITKVLGGPYSVGSDIAMYDKNGNAMALMSPNSAEIRFQTGYSDLYDVIVIVQNGAILQVQDKKTHESVFSITIPTKECVKFEADGYNVVDLPEDGKLGIYNGGKAIYKDGNNVLFSTSTCYLYSEIGLEGTYEYDRELDAVKLTLYQLSDISKKYPIKVWFKVKPYIEG